VSRNENFDRKKLKLKSLTERANKVTSDLNVRILNKNASAADFIDSLPDLLAVHEMRTLAKAILRAKNKDNARIMMYGGHVLKCGLGPLLVKWLESGRISCFATNGAGTIHDIELALFGETSEDVKAGIADGSFGMWKETGEIYAEAVSRAYDDEICLGAALGLEIIERGGDPSGSPLATAYELGIPVSVHISLGCDIVHPHPALDWSKMGSVAEHDFDLFGSRIAGLKDGVIMNVGSAVVMPEVFLKLLTSAVNLGNEISNITAAGFDMQKQYRSMHNVIERPVKALGGSSVMITGHHELMLPLLDLFIDAEEAK